MVDYNACMISRHNGRTIVRHNSEEATPFLQSLGARLQTLGRYAKLKGYHGYVPRACDLGCGNGRNSRYLLSLGFDVMPFDLKPDYGMVLDLERRQLPLFNDSVNIVLLQYIMMFLTPDTREWLVQRVLGSLVFPSMLVVEVMPVKTGLMSAEDCEFMIANLIGRSVPRFRIVRHSKYKVALTDLAPTGLA